MGLFAIGLIGRLRVAWYGTIVTLGLFVAHLFFTGPGARMIFAFIFLGLFALLIIIDRGRILEMGRRARSVFLLRNDDQEKGPASAPRGD